MSRSAGRGFTMIELMIVIALIAIVLALAVPSFQSYLSRKRVDGVMTELSTDLQYARSEAVARNARVRITFGTRCYVMTAQPDLAAPTSSCTETGAPTLGAGTALVKLVQITGATADLTPVAALAWIEFDPVRGIATFSTGATPGEMKVTAPSGSPQLRAVVQTVGRFCIDSPDGSIKGYTPCT